MGDDDVEEDETGAGVVDDDVLDRQPQEELLLGEADDVGQRGVAEICSDNALEEDPRLELRQARPLQEHLQPPRPVQAVRPDHLRQEPRRQPLAPEELVDRVLLGGGERRDEKKPYKP